MKTPIRPTVPVLFLVLFPSSPRRKPFFPGKKIPGIDPFLAACLDRATEDVDRVVDTIKRRENSSGSGGRGDSAGAASVGSRASRKSGMGSSRGQGSKRCVDGVDVHEDVGYQYFHASRHTGRLLPRLQTRFRTFLNTVQATVAWPSDVHTSN